MNAPKISILSQRSANKETLIKPSGKIRPGIKVLTRAAAENPKAAALYAEGLKQRKKFSEIEKEIVAATKINNPMYPRNTRYFNIAASDFGMPEIADLIISRYGEVRGNDPEKRLYRFPVVFHSDELSEIYPNSYRRFGGEPGYESHYGEDGQRYCRYLPEVTPEMMAEQKARRIKRAPRRDKVIRGVCNPSKCTEYLQGQCRFRGTLNFYIPGIPTTGLLVMETTSEYSAETIWSDLDRIHTALGTIPRSNPNKPGTPVFWITKVEENRTYFDEHGKKTGLQWVPKLQADIDLGGLLATGVAAPRLASPVTWMATAPAQTAALPSNVQSQADAGPGQHPSGQLPANASTQANSTMVDPIDQVLAGIEELQISEEIAALYLDAKYGQDWENDPDKATLAMNQIENLKRVGSVCAQKLVAITIAVHDLKIEASEFQRYLFLKYGRKFTHNEALLTQIVNELCELADSGPEVAQSFIRAQITTLEARAA